MTKQTARNKAEEAWTSLQQKAREFIEAEQGLVASAKELIDENGLSPKDVNKMLEDVLGRIKGNRVWDTLSTNSAVATLSDYRTDLEQKVEQVATRIFSSLQIATTADLAAVEKKVKSLNRKTNELNRKLKALEAA